jgi:Zn-dependent protease
LLSSASKRPPNVGPKRQNTIIYTPSTALINLPLALSNGELTVGALVVAILILSLGIHEAAHAWVASLCGDSTAKSMGRMTLNPIPHIDPIMTVLLPGFLVLSGSPFVFGGAKPVPVVYQRLRKPARDMMLVALAGPISNLLIALFLLVILKVFVYTQDMSMGANDPVRALLSVRPGTATILTQVLSQSVLYNALLAVFNMIPIPPLDGSRVVAYLLPEPLRGSFQALDRFSMLIIFGLLLSGLLSRPIWTGIIHALEGLHMITGGVWL